MPYHSENSSAKKRLRRIFLLIGLVLLSPLLFAWYYYLYHPIIKYDPTTQSFRLHPSIPFSLLPLQNQAGVGLPEAQWHYKWILFYVTPLPCTDVCYYNLAKINYAVQEFTTLQQPLDVVVATFPNRDSQSLDFLLAHNYPNFIHVYIKESDFNRVFSSFPDRRTAMFVGTLYVVNPKDHIVASYSPNASEIMIASSLAVLLKQYALAGKLTI